MISIAVSTNIVDVVLLVFLVLTSGVPYAAKACGGCRPT